MSQIIHSAARRLIGRPLPADLHAQLVSLVNRIGESAAREQVGLSQNTFARALAGLNLQNGTISLVRVGLERVQIPDSGSKS